MTLHCTEDVVTTASKTAGSIFSSLGGKSIAALSGGVGAVVGAGISMLIDLLHPTQKRVRALHMFSQSDLSLSQGMTPVAGFVQRNLIAASFLTKP